MSTLSPPVKAVCDVLKAPKGGIVGLVDDLLTSCPGDGLQLDWQDGRFRVRSSTEDWHELSEVPIRRSVFRANLARLAYLCNCSPYGGRGDIALEPRCFT
jgi:hypothetical protein